MHRVRSRSNLQCVYVNTFLINSSHYGKPLRIVSSDHLSEVCFLLPFGIAVCNCKWTYWGRDEKAAIFQNTFSNAFSWMEICHLDYNFNKMFVPRVQFKVTQRWFRQWFGAEKATSHYYLNKCWFDSLTHTCSTIGDTLKPNAVSNI